jgi:nicotinamidase-related amidase
MEDQKLKSNDRLHSSNAVFLPVDYMPGLMVASKSIDMLTLMNNTTALFKLAELFKLPTIGTGDKEGNSFMGAEMLELHNMVSDSQFIPRHTAGAWDEPAYVEAVQKTGRTHLILAGITTEQCVTFIAEPAIAAGYKVYVVLDCSASLDARSEQAAIARLTQMGAILTTWSPLGAELLRDYTRPETAGVFKIYGEHLADGKLLNQVYYGALNKGKNQ